MAHRSLRGTLATLGLLLGASSAPVGAQTTTVTFNEFAPGTSLGGSIVTQGYRFQCVSVDGTPCTTLASIGAAAASGYTGSTALFNNNAAGITTITRVDGGAFDLLGLDMSLFASTAVGGPVLFEATRVGGTTVAQTLTLGGTPGVLTSYAFAPSFRNVLSVRYRGRDFALPFTGTAPQVDNVLVASTVPEPSTWALLGTGLLTLAGVAHRRRTRG